MITPHEIMMHAALMGCSYQEALSDLLSRVHSLEELKQYISLLET